MTYKMKAVTKLFMASALGTSLFLSPAISQADAEHRGSKNAHYSVKNSNHHDKGRQIRHAADRAMQHHGKYHQDNRNVRKHHGHGKYRHDHGKYHHDHNSYDHTHYVVKHDYYDHYALDHLKFIIGLHTDNLDIILRD